MGVKKPRMFIFGFCYFYFSAAFYNRSCVYNKASISDDLLFGIRIFSFDNWLLCLIVDWWISFQCAVSCHDVSVKNSWSLNRKEVGEVNKKSAMMYNNQWRRLRCLCTIHLRDNKCWFFSTPVASFDFPLVTATCLCFAIAHQHQWFQEQKVITLTHCWSLSWHLMIRNSIKR